MSRPFRRLRQFFAELKRRNVYKVAVAYIAVAFVVLQGARLLVPALVLPEWFYRVIVALALLGFPLSLVLAWAFEMTPEGVRRTETAEGEPTTGSAYQWIGLALVVVLAGGVWYVTAGGEEGTPTEATATTDTASQTASTARDTAAPPRIAVLPFENISRDTGDAFFAEGMHEEVLNQLSKVSGLEVISRTSVMQYAETNKTVREISKELGGVNALLEGTVRRTGDQVRITTQLIDAREDAPLWSNTYERQLSVEEIFDIQADLAQRIAESLETTLAEGERERIQDAPTDDLAAYDAYLQGRSRYFQAWATYQPADIGRSIEALREAVRRDSTFAEAHAWLGLAYAWRFFLEREDRWSDSASVAVERARSIEGDLAAVHLAQGWIYGTRDSTAAEIASLRRALELQPSHAFARARLSNALRADEQYVEAVRAAHRAVRLAPRHPVVLTEMAEQLRGVGLSDAGAAWYRHILEIEPGHLEAIRGLALIQQQRGHPKEALATLQRYLEEAETPVPWTLQMAASSALKAGQPAKAKAYLERIPEARRRWRPEQAKVPSELDSPRARGRLGLAELRLGHRERGRELLQQAADSLQAELAAQEASEGRTDDSYYWRKLSLAERLVALGQSEEALRQLEAAVPFLPVGAEDGLVGTPFFDDQFRSHPRFQKIVGQLEARREKLREEVRQLGIDLYPPGAKPDSVTDSTQTDG